MPHTSLSYIIILPLLLVLALFFPITTSMTASTWTTSCKRAVLKEIASNLASMVRQLYISVKNDDVPPGNLTQLITLPNNVEGCAYTATASLRSPKDGNGSVILTICLELQRGGVAVNATTILGPGVRWGNHVLNSGFPDPSIRVEKFGNGTMIFSFERGEG